MPIPPPARNYPCMHCGRSVYWAPPSDVLVPGPVCKSCQKAGKPPAPGQQANGAVAEALARLRRMLGG